MAMVRPHLPVPIVLRPKHCVYLGNTTNLGSIPMWVTGRPAFSGLHCMQAHGNTAQVVAFSDEPSSQHRTLWLEYDGILQGTGRSVDNSHLSIVMPQLFTLLTPKPKARP